MYRPATTTAPRHGRPRRSTAEAASPAAPCIGTVTDISPDGEPMITSPMHPAPISARLLANALPGGTPLASILSQQVFLAFDRNDTRRPIILGLLSPLPSDAAPPPETASLDARQIDLRADKEITLRCGKASITLRQDGKIILRGTHLLSRSSGPIRIKGGHVEIN